MGTAVRFQVIWTNNPQDSQECLIVPEMKRVYSKKRFPSKGRREPRGWCRILNGQLEFEVNFLNPESSRLCPVLRGRFFVYYPWRFGKSALLWEFSWQTERIALRSWNEFAYGNGCLVGRTI